MTGRDVLLSSAAALMALTAALVPAPVLAQAPAAAATPRDVGAADPLRPVLLNALRPAIVADLGQSVKFVVATLRTQGDWAYVVARILYVPAYTYGLAPWRSVIWMVGLLATLTLLVSALI